MLAALVPLLKPLLQALVRAIIESFTDREEIAVKTSDATVLRPERTSVVTGRQKLEAMKEAARRRQAFRSGATVIPIVALLLFAPACSTRETTRTERTIVPVILDNGKGVPNGAKVATSEPIPVVVFDADGKPVPGDQPSLLDASGMVVMPPHRVAELQAAERALGAVMLIVDAMPDRETASQIETAVALEMQVD